MLERSCLVDAWMETMMRHAAQSELPSSHLVVQGWHSGDFGPKNKPLVQERLCVALLEDSALANAWMGPMTCPAARLELLIMRRVVQELLSDDIGQKHHRCRGPRAAPCLKTAPAWTPGWANDVPYACCWTRAADF